jgi:hypothetical protein
MAHHDRHTPPQAHDPGRDESARADLARQGVDLDRVWAGVAGEVWAREIGQTERLAGRLLRAPGLARALTATPSLLLSWIIASATVLVVGVVSTRVTGTSWVPLLSPALAAAASPTPTAPASIPPSS